MPSPVLQSVGWEAERAELQSVLQSHLLARSPALTHLLSYLCEKKFAGETDQIKEYSVALDVFDRADSFDQDSDSIVRVQANRLRKRLAEYYANEGASHSLRITIPVGQYIPSFETVSSLPPAPCARAPDLTPVAVSHSAAVYPWVIGGLVMFVVVGLAIFLNYQRSKPQANAFSSYAPQTVTEPPVGLPVGEEVHILVGATRKYVDHAGKLWSPDSYFSGGSSVRSAVQHIWRTQDPAVYRNSRQGDFAYDIPLKQGVYELHLHFAETFYGPENPAGGGEGSRLIDLLANGQPLLHDFDVIADAGGDRTADVKVFPDISPAADGKLHLKFSSAGGGSAMVSAIEILPGVSGHLRPVRIVARDAPYYSNDSRWWSPDTYFKGGQLSASQQPANDTDDPEFYETERWGHFSYAIPVSQGRHTVTLHFIERRNGLGNSDPAQPNARTTLGNQQDHVFNVFCNGKTILANLNIFREAGENHPLVKKISGLVPNAQGKLLLEFVPVTRYATVTAIEVVPE